MKEKSAADELTKSVEFTETRNDWYTKEEKKKRGGKRTPKVQTEEGSSSQPQKKRRKKTVETLLVDEPEEDETEANVDRDQDQLSPETGCLMKDIDDTLEAGKSASKTVVDDEDESSSDANSDIDAQVDKWIKENYDPRDKEKQKKRKRSADDDDETYVPPKDVQGVQTPPSGGRKKSTSRKRVVSPAVRKLKIKLKSKPIQELQSKPPSPPPQQPPSPPPQQPSPEHLQSPPQHPISSPIHEQPFITSPYILQTSPTTQPPVQTTHGSSGFKDFPPIPEDITLEKLDDFSFVNDDLVKKLQKKVDDVLVEKK
ncbi:hypothetical protein HanOQP8_Chr03g0091921 [Helianthus annuus]|nr:hypothetical protein HanOQP8_Chr03g0091921 [Helianthus annuus]